MSTATFSILEQPLEHGHRFRYETEKRDGGNLHGEYSGKFGHKSYPKLKLSGGIKKSDRHYVIISCVEAEPCQFDKDDQPKYRVHPCSVTGRHVENGICKIYFDKNQSLATLDHVGIQIPARRSIDSIIKSKLKLGLDFFKVGKTSEKFDMKKIRLSFQVHVWNQDSKKYIVLPPQVSNVISDQRCYNPLNIDEINITQAPFEGDAKIMILTHSKINKTDTNIVFETEDGQPLYFNLAKPDFYGTQALIVRSPKILKMDGIKTLNTKLFLTRHNKDKGTYEESNKIDFVFTDIKLEPFEMEDKSRHSSGYNSDVDEKPLAGIQAPPSSTLIKTLDLNAVNLLFGDGDPWLSEAAQPVRQGTKHKHHSEAFQSARSISNPSKRVAPINNSNESGPSFAEQMAASGSTEDFLQYVMDASGIFQEQEIKAQPTSDLPSADQDQNAEVIMEVPSSGVEFDLSMLLSFSDI